MFEQYTEKEFIDINRASWKEFLKKTNKENKKVITTKEEKSIPIVDVLTEEDFINTSNIEFTKVTKNDSKIKLMQENTILLLKDNDEYSIAQITKEMVENNIGNKILNTFSENIMHPPKIIFTYEGKEVIGYYIPTKPKPWKDTAYASFLLHPYWIFHNIDNGKIYIILNNNENMGIRTDFSGLVHIQPEYWIELGYAFDTNYEFVGFNNYNDLLEYIKE